VLEYSRFPGFLSEDESRYIESETKYAGYIRKQGKEISKALRMDATRIPGGLDFRGIPGLTREAAERCEKLKPATLGEARKIPGMTPAAVQNIGLYLEVKRKRGGSRPPVPRETGPDDE
jgi:tRNA uridine 5-carboxymethylaminomethyl modification enzyme